MRLIKLFKCASIWRQDKITMTTCYKLYTAILTWRMYMLRNTTATPNLREIWE